MVGEPAPSAGLYTRLDKNTPSGSLVPPILHGFLLFISPPNLEEETNKLTTWDPHEAQAS